MTRISNTAEGFYKKVVAKIKVWYSKFIPLDHFKFLKLPYRRLSCEKYMYVMTFTRCFGDKNHFQTVTISFLSIQNGIEEMNVFQEMELPI